MKVIRPTTNPLTNGYSENHRGLDFAGVNLPDEIRSVADGIVVEVENQFNSSWRNTGQLTTRDYGNYVKVRHDDGSYALYAHLKQHSMQGVGRKVKAGDVIARIGSTGNSTGNHLHFELRNAQNQNIMPEFIDYKPPIMEDNIKRKSYFADIILQAIKGAQINTDKVTEQEVKALIVEILSWRERSGRYDQLARKAGYEGDTNTLSHEELFKMVNSTLQKENKILSKKLAESEKLRLSEYKRGREDMKKTILEFTEKQ